MKIDSRTKKTIGSLLRIAISIGILVFIFSRIGFDAILEALTQANVGLFAAALGVYFASVVVRSIRWSMMLRPLDIDVNILQLTRLYLLGFFWDTFLPTGFGGDVVKSIELSRSTGQTEHAITSIVGERVVGLLGTCMVALIAIAISPSTVPQWVIFFIAGLSVAIVGGIATLRLDIHTRIAQYIPLMQRITQHKTVRKFDTAIKTYTLTTFTLALLTSIPFTLLLVSVNFLLGKSLGADIPILFYGVFVPVVSVVNLLPLSFNGLGVREYMYDLLFSLVGLPSSIAVVMALLFNFMRILLGVVGGVISITQGTQNLLKSEAAETPS